jgi:hypothetical protein
MEAHAESAQPQASATPAPFRQPRHPRLWWALGLTGQFVLVFSVSALTGPGRIDIVDGQTRYEVARSLVEHGDSRIRDSDVWFRVHPGREGARYTPYRFPQSGGGVLAILAADATGEVSEPRRHFFFVLISAVAASVLAVTYSAWFRGIGLRPGACLAWGTAGIFCTPSWFYSTSTFDDMLGATAIVLATAVAFLGRERRPLLAAGVAGLLMAWAINCKEPLALFVLPVLAALYRPGLSLRRFLAPAALVLLGAALGVAAYKAYDAYKFPPGTPDPNADYVEKYGAMWTADPRPGIAGLALSPSAGLIWYCPPFLLALAGWTVWRRQWAGFCAAAGLASLLFAFFLCFLTFFKGEPCWGPRYLTPVIALWWVFVPAAAVRVRPFMMGLGLSLGVIVQLLALSVDPQRLLLEKGISFTYYVEDPWLQFHPGLSHLLQRPREIRHILNHRTPAPEYSPAPFPTYATRVPSAAPAMLSSVFGHAAAPMPLRPLSAISTVRLAGLAHGIHQYKDAVRRYHVFASFRPWVLSQSYLAPADRPVDLLRTALLLLGTTALGLVLMIGSARMCARGLWVLPPTAEACNGRAAPG